MQYFSCMNFEEHYKKSVKATIKMATFKDALCSQNPNILVKHKILIFNIQNMLDKKIHFI